MPEHRTAAVKPKPHNRPHPSIPKEAPPTVAKRVVVLMPDDASSFASTLPALENELAARGFEVMSINGRDVSAALADPNDAAKTYVIAIGGEAAEIGAHRLHLPTVYWGVATPNREAGDNLYGVASLPPLELQLRAWTSVSPRLRRVALILGPGRDATIAEAEQAAAQLSVSLVYRVASTDQEALYLFKRLAPKVDGLWLLPDSVLSPRAIKGMLGDAARNKVQSLVFTPSLLSWGALFSVSSTPENVAWTLAEVAAGMASDPKSTPPLTPLSELELQVNEKLAEQFGVDVKAATWVVRGGT
ncbi:MAG TPA: ABC transporter substrate binding protein [Gammaproteobacteria bacterium]|nr:ABC transporter substrate binding protein [Gammaproteobacteria bacterium]